MNIRICRIWTIILTLALFANAMNAEDWKPAPAPLMSPWADDVDPNSPLPEYPRPTMVRSEWLSLNGIWEFGEMALGDALPSREELPERILVPFAWESALSGLRKEIDTKRAWYLRAFEKPGHWKGQAVLLHFGAVDWEAKVFVNGHFVGEHRGGFDAFSFDITPYLEESGEQEIAVAVYDPTNDEGIAVGKQSNGKFAEPSRFTYSPVSGIWQTVWLEPVPAVRIESMRIVPDIDRQTVSVKIDASQRSEDLSLEIIASDDGREISRAEGDIEKATVATVPHPRLWWPHDPHLYDLEINLKKDGRIVDSVKSYFGMRKIAIADHYQGKLGPFKKIELNDRFIFHMGPLDQGYWPDGLFTAPTDEALRWEIEQMKAWGFNMVRKHIKVEPERWFYWCDKLGLLVYQDMPSTFKKRTETEKTQFEIELQKMVKTHWNHPSIVNWIVFNEHWGAYDVPRLTRMVMDLDPTRLVTGNSGIDAGRPNLDYEVGHIKDNHHYRPPTAPYVTEKRAAVNGEYGAIGYLIEGHMWDDDGPWVHYNYEGIDAATEEYAGFIEKLRAYKEIDALSAAVYTQWTDLENEMNGLYTYDRKVVKLHKDQVTKANLSLWESDLASGASPDQGEENLDGGPAVIE